MVSNETKTGGKKTKRWYKHNELGTWGFKAHRDCFKQNKNDNKTNLTELVESKKQLLLQTKLNESWYDSETKNQHLDNS